MGDDKTNSDQVYTQQDELSDADSTQFSQEWLHSRSAGERKRRAELEKLRRANAKKHGIKKKEPKSSTERSRELRARKKLLVQSVNDQR